MTNAQRTKFETKNWSSSVARIRFVIRSFEQWSIRSNFEFRHSNFHNRISSLGVPDFPGDGKILYYFGLPGWMSGFFQETAMDRLLTMDKQEYVSRMQLECRRIMEEIADAVNTAPTGNVISGAEMQVRDLMGELRRKAFETAVQMRIDSTESNFSPCEGSVRQTQGKKGARVP
jgi:hypothetical protein